MIRVDDYQTSPAGPNPGEPGEPYTLHEFRVMVAAGGGSVSFVLQDGRVMTCVVQTANEAQALAAARIDRAGSDLLAADCKPVAHAVSDALVAAGLGNG